MSLPSLYSHLLHQTHLLKCEQILQNAVEEPKKIWKSQLTDFFFYQNETNMQEVNAYWQPYPKQGSCTLKAMIYNSSYTLQILNGRWCLIGYIPCCPLHFSVSELFPCYEQFPGLRPQIKVFLQDQGQSPRILSFLSPRRWSCHHIILKHHSILLWLLLRRALLRVAAKCC